MGSVEPSAPDPSRPEVLRCTIAGSLPKPRWLAGPDRLWAPWVLEGAVLEEGKRDAVVLAIRDQERAGIDIVSDGEQTRRHFVTSFIDALDGVDFEHRATVTIRRRYEASVPRVTGPVARPRPVYVDDARFAVSQTSRPLKYQLPGPMTMADTLADEHYGDRERLAWAFAEIINTEARELEGAGVSIIQFDEPAFNVYMDQVADWGIRALERAAEGLTCKTMVHICYGYGIEANINWKLGLGSEWRQYEDTFPVIAASTIDGVSLEAANSRVPMELMGLLDGKDVMVGVIDVATDEIETPAQVAERIADALHHVPVDRLMPATNCGMVPLSRETARRKLSALGDGVALARRALTA